MGGNAGLIPAEPEPHGLRLDGPYRRVMTHQNLCDAVLPRFRDGIIVVAPCDDVIGSFGTMAQTVRFA
jgi:hypothetical protein